MAAHATSTLESEYRALTEGAGVIERRGRGKLDVTGPDSLEYLQGQVTNDVESLSPGQGCYAAILNAKGHMLADARVLARGAEELWLDTEPVALERALADLRMYKIGRRVEVSDRTSERAIVSIVGPRAGGSVSAALGLEERALPAAEHAHLDASLDGDAVVVARTDLGFDLLLAADAAARAIEALAGHGATAVGPEAAEIVRVESGRPRYGLDMGEENLPAEAGIVERAVSFTKGCYVGQEPVARMHYKGRPNRHLRGLELSGQAQRGDALRASGKQVGAVTSASVSPARGPIALALVRREIAPGEEVEVGEGGVRARVVELPFEARNVRELPAS
jgi:tRNA-modifying protein YgfZ